MAGYSEQDAGGIIGRTQVNTWDKSHDFIANFVEVAGGRL